MNYTEYTNMSTEELLAITFDSEDPDPLSMELAIRLAAAEAELDDMTEHQPLEQVLQMVERRTAMTDRRQVQVERGDGDRRQIKIEP